MYMYIYHDFTSPITVGQIKKLAMPRNATLRYRIGVFRRLAESQPPACIPPLLSAAGELPVCMNS